MGHDTRNFTNKCADLPVHAQSDEYPCYLLCEKNIVVKVAPFKISIF